MPHTGGVPRRPCTVSPRGRHDTDRSALILGYLSEQSHLHPDGEQRTSAPLTLVRFAPVPPLNGS
ncbi:hypothetical protein STRIP9103_05246 [Streptomyces ipomoeae 91-03]|uniref:Uncharacterized protein n=1 Tax=Streptomyces ipomoeae 91-03 TaxID=698759 RepID=L1KXG1_9ACTN|nr:hypothetical protein STRIP9103_05246 [Streptomyces ipomoeae 91-03]